jgi:hypothetical protein
LDELSYNHKPTQNLYVFCRVFGVRSIDTLYENPDENYEAVFIGENADEGAEYDE